MGNRLFKFSNNIGAEWFYTDGREKVFDGDTYTAQAIKFLERERSMVDSAFRIELPLDLQPTPKYVNANGFPVLTIDIMDLSGTIEISGKVKNVRFRPDVRKGIAEFEATGDAGLDIGDMPYQDYGPGCNYEVGEDARECTVDLDLLAVTVAVGDVTYDADARTITGGAGNIGSEDDKFWSWGSVFCTGTGEVMWTFNHVGDVVELLAPFDNTPTGNFVFKPGCDGTLDTCKDKFDNVPEFAGSTLTPHKNPALEGLGEFA